MTFIAQLIEFLANHYILTGIFVVLLALFILQSSSRSGRNITSRELTGLVNKDEGIVVDIRPAKDFSQGHITGSLNIPADKLKSRMGELEKHKAKTIIIICANGVHSGPICTDLKKAGFTVARLSGGITNWKQDNLPLVK